MMMLNELFSLMTLVKAGAAIVMVVLLSLLAEVVSPRFAGILSGFPLGAALSLFFIGMEINTWFAAQSALFTSVGLIATQVFAYVYYRVVRLASQTGRGMQILCASAGGLAGYFLTAALLRSLRVNIAVGMLLPALSICAFTALFRHVENVRIVKRVSLNAKALMVRSVFAAIAVSIITSAARIVGPDWAGLFAAFPVTMLPFVVIIHATYQQEHVFAVLKNVPRGLGAIIAYCTLVFLFYPTHGIVIGTLIAYAAATVYLVLIQLGGGLLLKR